MEVTVQAELNKLIQEINGRLKVINRRLFIIAPAALAVFVAVCFYSSYGWPGAALAVPSTLAVYIGLLVWAHFACVRWAISLHRTGALRSTARISSVLALVLLLRVDRLHNVSPDDCLYIGRQSGRKATVSVIRDCYIELVLQGVDVTQRDDIIK